MLNKFQLVDFSFHDSIGLSAFLARHSTALIISSIVLILLLSLAICIVAYRRKKQKIKLRQQNDESSLNFIEIDADIMSVE